MGRILILLAVRPSREEAHASSFITNRNRRSTWSGRTHKQRERGSTSSIRRRRHQPKVMPPPCSSPINSVFPSSEFRGPDDGLLRLLIDLWSVGLCGRNLTPNRAGLGVFSRNLCVGLLTWRMFAPIGFWWCRGGWRWVGGPGGSILTPHGLILGNLPQIKHHHQGL